MLEEYPDLERDISRALIEHVKQVQSKVAPVLALVGRHRVFEGDAHEIVRSDASRDQTEFVTLSSIAEIPVELVLRGPIEEIVRHHTQVAMELSKQQVEHMFSEINKAVDAVGNVVNGGGGKLTADHLLAMLDKIHIEFERDGTPRFPTMVNDYGQVIQSPEITESEYYKSECEKIIARKRMEWNDREARRTLVG